MKDGVPSDRFAKEITDSIHNADKATKPYKSLLDSLYTTAGKVKKAKTVEEMLKAQFETTEKVFDYYKNDFQISYFGDRIYKMGNDNAIAHEVVDCGGTIFSVENPKETMRIMQTLIEQDERACR